MREGMAVWRDPGDRAMLPRWARVPRQVAVLLPRRSTECCPSQCCARRRSLDGRVGRVLLRHESRFDSRTVCRHFLHFALESYIFKIPKNYISL